jgi:hypothetical protein
MKAWSLYVWLSQSAGLAMLPHWLLLCSIFVAMLHLISHRSSLRHDPDQVVGSSHASLLGNRIKLLDSTRRPSSKKNLSLMLRSLYRTVGSSVASRFACTTQYQQHLSCQRCFLHLVLPMRVQDAPRQRLDAFHMPHPPGRAVSRFLLVGSLRSQSRFGNIWQWND